MDGEVLASQLMAAREKKQKEEERERVGLFPAALHCIFSHVRGHVLLQQKR